MGVQSLEIDAHCCDRSCQGEMYASGLTAGAMVPQVKYYMWYSLFVHLILLPLEEILLYLEEMMVCWVWKWKKLHRIECDYQSPDQTTY